MCPIPITSGLGSLTPNRHIGSSRRRRCGQAGQGTTRSARQAAVPRACLGRLWAVTAPRRSRTSRAVQVQTRMSEQVRTSDKRRHTHAEGDVWATNTPTERCARSAHVWLDPGPREGRAGDGRAAVGQDNGRRPEQPGPEPVLCPLGTSPQSCGAPAHADDSVSRECRYTSLVARRGGVTRLHRDAADGTAPTAT